MCFFSASIVSSPPSCFRSTCFFSASIVSSPPSCFRSKFHIVHDQYEKEQQMVRTNRKEKQACTGQALARLLGMELCASLAFPNATTALTAPYFPFTGPTSVSVTLRKHDVHSGYKLLAKQIKVGLGPRWVADALIVCVYV